MSTQKREELKQIFSNRIRSLIGDEPVAAFARAVGLKQAAVDRYVKMKNIPTADALVAISSACGVSTDWLLGLSDNKSSTHCVTATAGSAAAADHSTATVHVDSSPECAQLRRRVERLEATVANWSVNQHPIETQPPMVPSPSNQPPLPKRDSSYDHPYDPHKSDDWRPQNW